MLLMMPVLLLMLGLVYDLGAIAIAQSAGQDAADLAVQDAVKYLTTPAFYARQEVQLSQGAVSAAGHYLEHYTGGQARLTGLTLVRPNRSHWALQLEAEIEIPLRFLRLIGIPTATRRLQAVAVPAFGIQREGQ